MQLIWTRDSDWRIRYSQRRRSKVATDAKSLLDRLKRAQPRPRPRAAPARKRTLLSQSFASYFHFSQSVRAKCRRLRRPANKGRRRLLPLAARARKHARPAQQNDDRLDEGIGQSAVQHGQWLSRIDLDAVSGSRHHDAHSNGSSHHIAVRLGKRRPQTSN